jgi:DNA-binding NarL/FixJ family response regulator
MSAVLVTSLVEEFRHPPNDRRRNVVTGRLAARLTRREWEVLGLLREGRRTGEIADELGISPITVRRHVSSLLRRLGVSSRNDALELFDSVHVA